MMKPLKDPLYHKYHQRFAVRCQCHWRIRSQPSLNSKALGAIAKGTFVVGDFVDDHGLSADSATATWIKVTRFEPPVQVDREPGGLMFCYRRNGQGHGLYKVGAEDRDGRLCALPDTRACDTAAGARAESEELSLTWKLLGTVDSITQFFRRCTEETGVVEPLQTTTRRRPDQLLEAQRRDVLKKAAKRLRQAATKLTATSGAKSTEKATVGMPSMARARFARLCKRVVETNVCSGKYYAADDAGELPVFIELCRRIESSGSWEEVGRELAQDLINFSQNDVNELDHHCRRLKAMPAAPIALPRTSSEGSAADLEEVEIGWPNVAPSQQPKKVAFETPPPPADILADTQSPRPEYPTLLPVLAPPPRSLSGVNQLVF